MNRKNGKLILFFACTVLSLTLAFDNYASLQASTVPVNISEETRLIPGGESIGINMNTDGVYVLGVSEFYGEDGKKHCPAKDAGIRENDIITKINDEKITSAGVFSALVDQCLGAKMTMEVERNGKTFTVSITPVKSTEDGKYHLGLWAREGTSGIGTLTFIEPQTKRFAALGHSVNDADTGKIVQLGSGNICYSAITNVIKGKKGIAGEMHGCFISTEIGQIQKNTEFGIYGNFYGDKTMSQSVPVALKSELETGQATIRCCIDGNNIEEFNVNVDRIILNSTDNKNMIISVTDKKMLSKTGGIVQGMSGSPILQNGKIVGAVTHVFVNDPTRGYGIFIENMLAEALKIK